jgi:hypothetical protein
MFEALQATLRQIIIKLHFKWHGGDLRLKASKGAWPPPMTASRRCRDRLFSVLTEIERRR